MSYIAKQLPHVWGLIYFLKKIHNIVSFLLEKRKKKKKKEREVSKSKRLNEM